MAEPGGGTESTSRVADVLLLFVEGPSTLGVTRIARELGLSKAVVHRILQSLAGRDMVVLDPVSREYRLGPSVAALGARALRESDLRSAALPLLRRLRDETRETATLSTPVPHGRVYLDQVVGLHEIKMTVELGRRFPLHAGSSGKCMLAHLDAEHRDEVLAAGLESLTPHTPVDPVALRSELDGIAARGWARLGRRAPGRRRLGGRAGLRRRRRRPRGHLGVRPALPDDRRRRDRARPAGRGRRRPDLPAPRRRPGPHPGRRNRKDGGPMTDGALDGLKVLDVATLFAGPLAATMLGDHGADVIKIEHPRGDPSRTHGAQRDGVGLWWKMLGRNKQAITLDLASPEGQEVFRTLAADADVVIENFRPGHARALGHRPGGAARGEPRPRARAGHRLRPVRARTPRARASGPSRRP